MENNEQKEILIEVKRISKNVQFFFWLTVISFGISLISVLALNNSTKTGEVDKMIERVSETSEE